MQQSNLLSLQQQQIMQLFNQKHVDPTTPLSYFRVFPVFHMPASITYKKLLELVSFCSLKLNQKSLQSLPLISRATRENVIAQETTIGQFYSQIQDKHDQTNGIIDLEYDQLELIKGATVSSMGKALQSEQPAIDIQYMALNKIFLSFEENGGVQLIIDTLQQSLTKWSNQNRAQRWRQYVMELYSFSKIPNYFIMYMKNKDCLELLFKLLQAEPDIKEDPKIVDKTKLSEESKHWDEEEVKAVKYCYDIFSQLCEQILADSSKIDKSFELETLLIQTMISRIGLISKENGRKWVEEIEEEEKKDQLPELKKKDSSKDDGKKKIEKKKGVGYGSDQTGNNQQWNIQAYLDNKKIRNAQIIDLLKKVESFLNLKSVQIPQTLSQVFCESPLLPILENLYRSGSLIDMTKEQELVFEYINITQIMAQHKVLVPCFLELDAHYQPKQKDSILELLKKMNDNAKIFLQCLQQPKEGQLKEEDKISEQLAIKIKETYQLVEKVCKSYQDDQDFEQLDDQQQEEEMKQILEKPLADKYKMLLQDLRFDYISMKNDQGKYQHYYSSYITEGIPPQSKMIRLAQELADISTGLPIEHTNSIFVRCDTDRVDVMRCLVFGSADTPYAHGAYFFDVYMEDQYPKVPPKCQLVTTGNGQVRFNPNLYSCGKVCLSLLGTWRGNSSENWDPKLSTLLQVLVSLQSIIMAEDVYFNEPGYEGEAGTVEGEKKNEGYSNIVRFSNIKFAMLDNIKNPPKGFETIIRRHFYLKKDEILKEAKKWIKFAEVRDATYVGLVNDHNRTWCDQFKKTKTAYLEMLKQQIGELETVLNSLQPPTYKELKLKSLSKKKSKAPVKKIVNIEKEGVVDLSQVDVGYEGKQVQQRELDINDPEVRDRWSRYIGAVGIEAVAKQSQSSVFISGMGPLGVEIAKNIILAGVKRFTIHDSQATSYNDLSGQFFLQEEDVGENRAERCVAKLRELNYYVKVDTALLNEALPVTEAEIESKLRLKDYSVVIITEQDDKTCMAIDSYCQKHNIIFIASNIYGPFARVFNDFGKEFTILDKNGETAVECMISSISNEEHALVKLLPGAKHPYQTGDKIEIYGVEGMEALPQEGQQEKLMTEEKSSTGSINKTVHTIEVVNVNSFRIGDTRGYGKYVRNGLCKNLKLPIKVQFKSMQDSLVAKDAPFDPNLFEHDFVKVGRSKIIHLCFLTLQLFRNKFSRLPKPWDLADVKEFVALSEENATAMFEEVTPEVQNVVARFALTTTSQLPPMAAFMGGFIAQEVIKAITNKYTPIMQLFYTDAIEVIPELPPYAELNKWEDALSKLSTQPEKTRNDGLKLIIGGELLKKLHHAQIFMIGCGAIGCELIKNFAMINLATGEEDKESSLKKGMITVTDTDHIENSNLNRQFLFREKHISKPKSQTSAAAAIQMNKLLKGHIIARLDKVHESTANIFTDKYFESLSLVANALDNIPARRYVDMRCVSARVPLLDSGTLGPKGNTQVVIPFQTESYGS